MRDNILVTAKIPWLFLSYVLPSVISMVVAAFTIINYIGNFATTVMFGISDGIGSIISCNFEPVMRNV